MFEAAEVGRKVSKATFREREPTLHTALLDAQQRLRASNKSVVIIVSGVEGAGKGAVVNRLSEWLDTRGLITQAFWEDSEEQRERPRYWRFWQALPPRGSIGILFGSWYTQPIVDRAFERIDRPAFDQELTRIREFERMLARDGTLIVKFWFHLDRGGQRKRLELDRKAGTKTSPVLKTFAKNYDRFARVSERALRQTDTGDNPWYVIEATDARYRDLTVGETLLAAIDNHLAGDASSHDAEDVSQAPPTLSVVNDDGARGTILDTVPLDRTMAAEDYERELLALQTRVHQLSWRAHAERVNVVAMFEGWDAAGKGGAIRRLTAGMDARLYRVISVAAPTDEERARHYLWRFWRHIPRGGYFTIYDRSWYGRVLVERVEGFASTVAWSRAYREINDFEEQLCEHGAVLLKYWLHIDADEQLRRFKEREVTPWKAHKITEEDWRNRDKWGAYEAAVNDMVARTSTAHAPWHLVPANDKKVARIEVLTALCNALEARLKK